MATEGPRLPLMAEHRLGEGMADTAEELHKGVRVDTGTAEPVAHMPRLHQTRTDGLQPRHQLVVTEGMAGHTHPRPGIHMAHLHLTRMALHHLVIPMRPHLQPIHMDGTPEMAEREDQEMVVMAGMAAKVKVKGDLINGSRSTEDGIILCRPGTTGFRGSCEIKGERVSPVVRLGFEARCILSMYEFPACSAVLFSPETSVGYVIDLRSDCAVS